MAEGLSVDVRNKVVMETMMLLMKTQSPGICWYAFVEIGWNRDELETEFIVYKYLVLRTEENV